MKKLAIIVLALTLGACTFVNPFTSVSNPVSTTNLYEGELVFDASLKTFDQLKSLCVTRVLPPSCRTYVKQGQAIIVNVYAADNAARGFITANPTLDATNIVQAFTGLVSTFKDTVNNLSTTKS